VFSLANRLILSVVLFATFPVNAFSADGKSILQKKCVVCHDITGPAPTTAEEALKRKAPDLFYAGIKYKKEWLVTWLEKPTRLRPAGYHFWDNLKKVKGKADVVIEENLKPHISLKSADAKAVAKTLMSFKANQNLITKNALTQGDAGSLAEMSFNNFSGCISCHQTYPADDENEPFGGMTGSEVYTIGNRLQPDFIYSYLKSPQSFDPRTSMPNIGLGENALQDLTKYMIELSTQEEE